MAGARRVRLRAVLDTSVLLSAERRALLLLATRGLYTIVWSAFIAEEVNRKLVEMGWSAAKTQELVGALGNLAEMVDYRQITGGNYDRWLKDPDDHPIMATALAGHADYLVTWNTRDFPPKRRFAGVTILTPDAFLRRLGSES